MVKLNHEIQTFIRGIIFVRDMSSLYSVGRGQGREGGGVMRAGMECEKK